MVVGQASPSRSEAPPFGLSTVLRASGAALDLLGLAGGGQPVRAAPAHLVGGVTTPPPTTAEPIRTDWEAVARERGPRGTHTHQMAVPVRGARLRVGTAAPHCPRRDVSLISDLLNLQQCLQDLARIKLQTARAPKDRQASAGDW